MATTPNKYLRENEEMRAHIARLKRDLEQEKNAVKQAHRDKVAEVKSAREEEEARYRRELETRLDKVRRDARNEKQNLERTLKQQLQFELEQRQKAQEEEINALKEKWSKEKNDILTKMKAKLQAEAMEEARKKFEVVRKQMTTEMFQMDTARNEAEEKAKIIVVADQEKAEDLRKQAEMHQAELDRIRREAQQADNQHRDEMKNKDRLLASKTKEIITLGEKLSRVQSERDKLQENLQRYKQGDSFHKMTPKSPSMGIGNKSFEEVTAATVTPKAYSEHEKELILKNGELSFRLKEVEKQNQMLKEMKDNLEHTVHQLKEASKPLEEKNKKLFQRCIEMQGAKQRQELRNNQLTSEIDELKSRNVTLEREVAQQHRRLTHMLGESGSSRGIVSSLRAQNERLKSDIKELHTKIQAGDRRCAELQLNLERMRKMNYKLKQKSVELEKARLPASPVPSNVSMETAQSDLAAVDEESHCSILQEELEQVTFDYAEMETNYGMLKREKLLLEKENSSLKQQLLGGEYDTQREDAKMQQLQHERDEALNKLQKMEDELLSIVDSDEAEGSPKEVQKQAPKLERETYKWHELEAKLVQTETSLAAAQKKVTEFTQREEQFLQQLQDVSGELEHSKEQHQAEISNLREELSKQELHKTTVEDNESKIMKLQQELQQQVRENEAIVQRKRDEMEAKERQHLAKVAKLKEAMKTADSETANTIEALRHKVSELELSAAKAGEQVFNLNREKASIEVSLQQQLAQVKEELDQVKDTSIAEQESWKERFASELKAQQSAAIDGLAKEHRAEVVGLEEQKVAITAELEESHLQLQQITTMMTEKERILIELTDKLSHSEQKLSSVRKILQEVPTLISQSDTVVTDSKTNRTINDVVRDLINEVDGGTLTLPVNEQASQAYDVHDGEKEHTHQLKETISNMQLVLNQLNVEKDQVKQEVNQLTQERDQLREGYNQLEQHIHQLSQERDQMKERYGQLEQQVIQISQLKGTNDQLEQQINQDQGLDKMTRKENELDQRINQLNQERARLLERQNHLERQVDRLNQQYTELKQANDELENLNNQLREENNSLREQLKSHDQMAQKREAQFKEQLMEDSKVLVEMQQQLNQSQYSLSNSLHQVDEKNSLLTTSQSKCQILESQLHESETRNHTLQKQHDKLQLEHAKLEREVSEISVTLKEMSVSVQQKEQELSVLRLQARQQQSQPILSKMNHAASNGVHKQRLFVTLLDYNPQSFCRSGHPERELQLLAGDVVNVIGDMNADGFYHVQFENKQGLVPAHFLEEMNIKNTTIKRRLHNQRLSNCSLTSNGDVNSDNTGNMVQYHSSEDEFHPSESVAPPTDVRVERVLQRGLVISWALPNITALGDSNGLKIQGYQVFIDDILNSTVLGCYQSKALIGSINIDKSHSVAVATFALNGTLSAKCQIQYKPIHISHDHPSTVTRSTHSSHQPLDPSPHHQNYQLMKVVHSPAPSDRQLRLQEGDIVKVFGRLRKDGNYVAEVHGDHVLVPGYLLIPVISGV